MNNMQSLARQTLASINPNLTVVKFQTFTEQIADRFTQDRMIAQLMTLFSILALLLATLGLYGVTAYTVARRTSEDRHPHGPRRKPQLRRRHDHDADSPCSKPQIGLAVIDIPVAWFPRVRYISPSSHEAKGMDLPGPRHRRPHPDRSSSRSRTHPRLLPSSPPPTPSQALEPRPSNLQGKSNFR